MWKRVKENAAAAAAVATVFIGFAALAQFGIVYPIQQRFDGIDQRFDDLRADMNQRFGGIDQRFGGIDQRFDDLRAEMNQRFGAIDQRFDDLRAEMNHRFDAQDKYINQRFDAVDQRFDALEERLGMLSGEVTDLRRLADRVSRNEGRLDAITQQLQAIGEPAP